MNNRPLNFSPLSKPKQSKSMAEFRLQKKKVVQRRTNYFEQLSSKVKSKFGEILLLIADEEQAIEQRRQNLCLIREFEPYSSFTRLDREGKGFIVSQDIVNLLHENRCGAPDISKYGCNYLVKFFDSSFSGHISYQDYLQIILPCTDLDLRTEVTQQRQTYSTHPSQTLSPPVERALSKLLLSEIQFHLKLEQMKIDLHQIWDFKLSHLFKLVDHTRSGFIDHNNMKRFLALMGHQVQSQEIFSIIRRIDVDGDQKIMFTEFSESFSLVSPDYLPRQTLTDHKNSMYLD